MDATKLQREGEWKPKKADDLKISFTPFNQQDEVEGINPGQATPGLQIDAGQLVEPLDFYKLFLTEEMVEEHVAETNRHAQTVKDRDASKMKPKSRAHKWKDTTVVEMLQFIGILLHMGIVRMPKIADYWRKTGETARLYMQDFYRGLMGRDRFQLVLRYWYYGEEDDPSGDQARDAKVASMIQRFNTTMRMIYVPRRQLSIDESLLAWRGRLSFRQYITNKAHKYGIKYFEVTSWDGLILRIVLYTAEGFPDPDELGQSGAIVLQLMKDFLYQGYQLYMDNWYNSVKLFQVLADRFTYVCGTVNPRRVGLPKKLLATKLKKNQWVWLSNKSLVVCMWYDKRNVLTMSNMHPEVKMEKINNRRGQSVYKPNTVLDYNRYMSGIDRADQLMSYNTSLRKTIRWYKKCAVHMLQVFLINAHYLYMEQAATRPELKKMTLLEFREKIIMSLVGEDKRKKKKAARRSMPRCGFHYLSSHPPTEKKEKPCKDCINCINLGRKRKQSRYFCSICPIQPTLCLEPCFKEWHSQLWRDEEATVNTSSSDLDSDSD